jgi:peptide chain release factor 1
MPSGGTGGVFDVEVIATAESSCVLRVSGKGARAAFAREAGGHRWQRVPPTEKRGRIHSSTVTVAVMPIPERQRVRLDPRDLRLDTLRGSGAGGQHRNKTDSAVRVTHLPTGTVVFIDGGRSQHLNKVTALDLLAVRMQDASDRRADARRSAMRREQVGRGERSDKIRTVAVQRGRVECHRTGSRVPIKRYLRGELDPLYR